MMKKPTLKQIHWYSVAVAITMLPITFVFIVLAMCDVISFHSLNYLTAINFANLIVSLIVAAIRIYRIQYGKFVE